MAKDDCNISTVLAAMLADFEQALAEDDALLKEAYLADPHALLDEMVQAGGYVIKLRRYLRQRFVCDLATRGLHATLSNMARWEAERNGTSTD